MLLEYVDVNHASKKDDGFGRNRTVKLAHPTPGILCAVLKVFFIC